VLVCYNPIVHILEIREKNSDYVAKTELAGFNLSVSVTLSHTDSNTHERSEKNAPKNTPFSKTIARKYRPKL